MSWPGPHASLPQGQRVWIFNILIPWFSGTFAFLSTLFLFTSWDTKPSLHTSLPTHNALCPLHLQALPGPAAWEPGRSMHTGLISFELQGSLVSSFLLFLSSVLVTWVSVPKLSCDLICHRCSPAPKQPPSIICLIGLGFVDNWGFSVSVSNKPETSTLNFLPTSLQWPDSESPGQGRCLYMPRECWVKR